MRRVLSLIGIPLAAWLPLQVAYGAEAVKLKYVTAAYADSLNVGMRNPEGVACLGNSFWVADTGNRRVLRYSLEDKIVTAEVEYPLADAYPLVTRVNSEGMLFVLDGKTRRVRRLGKAGEDLGYLDPAGVPAPAKIVPRSLALDRDGHIYLLDIFGRRVVVLDGTGNYLRHIAFPTDYGALTDLTVKLNGDVLVVDSVRCRVYTAAKSATAFTPLTEEMKGYMSFPTAIAADDRGLIYLIDQHGNGVVLVAPDGGYLGRQLGLGWDDAGLYYPTQVCVSDQGTLFIADRNNSRVQVFTIVRK